MITLYDFDTNLPGRTWSPFTWRVRIALNLKGIEHQTEWVQYVDVQKTMQELGMPPSQILGDGTPRYTVPSIHDHSTNAKVSDSYEIIKYLDEAYPTTPRILPEVKDDHLQVAFQNNWDLAGELLLRTGIVLCRISLPLIPEDSRTVYQGRFEAAFNIEYEAYMKDNDAYETYWKQAEETYGKANAWIAKAEQLNNSPWALGATPTWPDIVIAASSVCLFMTAVGADGKEWKRVSQWDGGRWERFWNGIKPFSTLH